MIPPALLEGLVRYRDNRIATGGFLRAVLANDLNGAIFRADDESLGAIPSLVRWIREELPIESWGTVERVNLWLAPGPRS